MVWFRFTLDFAMPDAGLRAKLWRAALPDQVRFSRWVWFGG